MLPLLLSATLWCCPIATSTAPARTTTAELPGDEKALRALEAWLKLYRDGKIDFRDKKNARNPVSEEYGLSPKNGLGSLNWAGDLDLILDAVAKLESEDAAIALLEVAAVGIEQGKHVYTVEMAPFEVRAAAELRITKLFSAPAKDQITKAARGELKVDKTKVTAFQTAAVRCIGLLKDPASRPLLEAALGDNDAIVRVTAAEALGALGDDTAALALIATLERDTVDAVLIAAAQSLRSLYARHLPKTGVFAPSPDQPSPDKAKAEPATQPGTGGGAAEPAKPAPASAPAPPELPESVRLAVRAAIKALGRGTWRSDMAVVNLLSDFRSQEAVPALIAVLERFQTHPDELKSGKLSGLLMYQAHELLVGMTGAVFPANQPEKWRTFWEAERDKIVIAQKREPEGGGATVVAGFCGMPVQGTRIVFVLDLSGSMEWPMDEVEADGKKKRSKRVDFAKRELHRAMDAISPNASFNLVTFNGDDKAEVWEKDLVLANEKNRTRFKKHVDGLKALGGTNLWAGLEEALKIKSLVYGNRYTTSADEIFVLSDGAPSVGDVQDPIEMLRLVQECNKFSQARINTFFISSATPPDQPQPQMSITPQDLMRRMAKENGGKFREL